MAKKKESMINRFNREVDEYHKFVDTENDLWNKYLAASFELIETQMVRKSYEMQQKEQDLANLSDEMNRLTQIQEVLKEIKQLSEQYEQARAERKNQ